MLKDFLTTRLRQAAAIAADLTGGIAARLDDFSMMVGAVAAQNAPPANRVILFHSRDTAELAKEIASKDPRIQLWDISWKFFPNGMPDTVVANPFDLRDRTAAILCSYDTLSDIIEQWMCKTALLRMGLKELKVILPYFPTSTMERLDPDKPGQVVTAKALATLLSALPVASGQKLSLVTYDLHAPQEVFYFGQSILVADKTAVKYIRRAVESKISRPVIVFPDYGAYNRFKKAFKGYDIVICNKNRLAGDGREVVIASGLEFVKGRHCVIFDDIIMKGGTATSCADALIDAGASAVSMACIHPDCPEDSWKKFIGSKFTHVFICDTVQRTIREVRGVDKFINVSLADSLRRVLVKDDNKNLP